MRDTTMRLRRPDGFDLLKCLVLVACAAGSTGLRAEERPVYLDPGQPRETRVEDLLQRLTIEEKIGFLHGDSKFSTAPVPRLGVPTRWLTDGPHGVREDVGPHTWNPAGRTDDYATYMPALSALASTWNVDLARAYGEVLGEECRARGKDILLGPIADIARTPLSGRLYEYFGEDPFLNARFSVNYIRGVQDHDCLLYTSDAAD